MMRQLFLTLLLAVSFGNCFSQGAISTLFHDESNGLVPTEGTAMINDAGANGGACMFRPASSAGGTFFAGPYVPVAAGNYLFQVRIKVSSNSSIANLFTLDIVSQYGAIVYGSMWITPNMFKASNEWQLITIPVSIPHGIPNLEMRGMNFQPGVTDMYVDYVQLIPSSVSGLYSPELTISGKGDVGIGTATPREKLSVNGKIRAQEIKVETANWPDYVFDEGYNVGTLEELEGYIMVHKHLPGIPSARELEENGIAVSEMLKLQQQKIEELTLHLIEKDKALKKVEVENTQLKAKQFEQATAIKKIIERVDKIELKKR